MVHKLRFIQILTTLILLLFLVQCGKSTNPQVEPSLIGHWLWVQTVHGSTGEIITPNSEGMYSELYFDSDSSVYIISSIASQTPDIVLSYYYISYEQKCNDSDSGNVLYMEYHRRSEIEYNNNILTLTLLCGLDMVIKYKKIP